ncbi:hypothetical protein [Novosphingobium sp. PhB165]|uniref:hypothetical protein n=1 Tax=Novosphingobium sp. PhB165 TaxID=2485105 RepID=UPI001FB4B8B3|nr:hypothetical protein [Novosphingobium sp. PhB165]
MLLAPVLLMTMAAPVAARNSAPPIPGGPLGTLALGRYNCEKDGDAGGPVGIPVPTLNFQVVIYSSYKGVDGVRGSYLLTGDDVVMTGGGLRGMRLHRISPGFLRVVGADGADTETRCVLSSRRPQFHGDSGSSSDSDSDG